MTSAQQNLMDRQNIQEHKIELFVDEDYSSFSFNRSIHQAMFMAFMNKLWNKSGGRLNKKDGLTRYGDSHVKDKTS